MDQVLYFKNIARHIMQKDSSYLNCSNGSIMNYERPENDTYDVLELEGPFIVFNEHKYCKAY